MLVKLIKNPKPRRWPFGGVQSQVTYPRPVIALPGAVAPVPEAKPTVHGLGINTWPNPPVGTRWTKLSYDQWVEHQKVAFPKGSMVTLSVIPPKPNELPVLMKVEDYNELAHHTSWCYVSQEPKCLIVKHLGSGIPYSRPPKSIRMLTEEELKLAILSNREPLGTA